MPQTQHVERHFTASETIRDMVIGMADGLTVPFALAAGLSGAVVSTEIIVTAGFAEIAAGSIAMGLGGYLAARSDAEHYASEHAREQEEVSKEPGEEVAEVSRILQSYGLTQEESATITEKLSQRPEAWVEFMMRFELGLEKPDPKRATTSALTIAGAYIAGGLIPFGALHFLLEDSDGVAVLRICHLAGVDSVWLCQGSFHGYEARAECDSNHVYRRPCSNCRLRDRQGNLIEGAAPREAWRTAEPLLRSIFLPPLEGELDALRRRMACDALSCCSQWIGG